MLLQVSGHEVRVAYSSQDALDMAGKYQPDIVLLDIGLPGMDGYEVARRLRKHPELKELKLIALTGYGQESRPPAISRSGLRLSLGQARRRTETSRSFSGAYEVRIARCDAI
jgi:CheY-like chemotaxis protein